MNDTAKPQTQAKDAAAKTDDKAPETKAEPKTPRKKEYVVQGGAISPEGGRRTDLIQPGEKVMLTAAEARHYIDLNRIAPSMPKDEDEE